MKKYFFLFILGVAPHLLWADIYSYLDSSGQRHFVNEPIKGAELITRLSPITEDTKNEDVQRLLESPRFSRTISMKNSSGGFEGNYPRPIAFIEEGFSAGTKPALTGGQIMMPRSTFTITDKGRAAYAPYITMIARQYGLHPALLHAVITTESAYNPKAKSHAGAMGLMQLIPATARRFGVDDPYDPIQNMHGGAAYLRFLIDHFGDISLALAGYNAGEGAVKKYGNKIPPYKETMNYVPKVLSHYQRYRNEGY